jgi:hypothetical protein
MCWDHDTARCGSETAFCVGLVTSTHDAGKEIVMWEVLIRRSMLLMLLAVPIWSSELDGRKMIGAEFEKVVGADRAVLAKLT